MGGSKLFMCSENISPILRAISALSIFNQTKPLCPAAILFHRQILKSKVGSTQDPQRTKESNLSITSKFFQEKNKKSYYL